MGSKIKRYTAIIKNRVTIISHLREDLIPSLKNYMTSWTCQSRWRQIIEYNRLVFPVGASIMCNITCNMEDIKSEQGLWTAVCEHSRCLRGATFLQDVEEDVPVPPQWSERDRLPRCACVEVHHLLLPDPLHSDPLVFVPTARCGQAQAQAHNNKLCLCSFSMRRNGRLTFPQGMLMVWIQKWKKNSMPKFT